MIDPDYPLRQICPHKRWSPHESAPGIGCPGFTTPTANDLIEALKDYAEAYGFRRSALGSPGIEFMFLDDVWDFDGTGHDVAKSSAESAHYQNPDATAAMERVFASPKEGSTHPGKLRTDDADAS